MKSKHDVAGAIIAGGKSSRMQAGGIEGDKFMLPLGEKTILQAIVDRFVPQVDQLVINSNNDPKVLEAFGLPVIKDLDNAKGGPLIGILSALTYAKDYKYLLTAAGDSPFIPLDYAKQMIALQKTTGAPIILASSQSRVHPIFGLWDTSLAQDLRHWLNHASKASIFAFAAQAGCEILDFPMAMISQNRSLYDPFFNINHPESLAEARQLYEII